MPAKHGQPAATRPASTAQISCLMTARLGCAGPDRELQGTCLSGLRLIKQAGVGSTGLGQTPGNEYTFKRWREGASALGASSFGPGENVVLSIEGKARSLELLVHSCSSACPATAAVWCNDCALSVHEAPCCRLQAVPVTAA